MLILRSGVVYISIDLIIQKNRLNKLSENTNTNSFTSTAYKTHTSSKKQKENKKENTYQENQKIFTKYSPKLEPKD